MPDPAAADPVSDREGLALRLADALAGSFPGPCRVEGLVRLSGGANAENWFFELRHAAGSTPLILRRRPDGLLQREGASELLPMELEAAVLRAVSERGLAAPRVHHVLSAADGAGSGYVMQCIEGETIARRILRDARYAEARPRVAAQCGAFLARLHALPARELPALPELGPRAQLERYFSRYQEHDSPRPVFELAFRWAREHLPEPTALALVHGDFRHGNLAIDASGLRGVLDWEIAHLGDPMEDLGWLCVPSWRFGEALPVGGLGTREALFDAYEAAGGGAVDPLHVRFWEVFGTLKWGLMCMGMVELFRSGADTSVERAAIGRRASETEIDLLDLLSE